MHEDIANERAHRCAGVPAANSAGAQVQVRQVQLLKCASGYRNGAATSRRIGARASVQKRRCAGTGAPNQATLHENYRAAVAHVRMWTSRASGRIDVQAGGYPITQVRRCRCTNSSINT